MAGRLSKKGRLEVLVDEGYWPAFATERWRSTHQPVDQVGEVFIRELDFSRITLRLNENDDGEKEEIFAECKCDTRELLETSMVSSKPVDEIECVIHLSPIVSPRDFHPRIANRLWRAPVHYLAQRQVLACRYRFGNARDYQ